MSQPPGEPWIRAAMSDDRIVADLLLRLKVPSPSSTTAVKPLKSWTITRQRRSRPPPPPHDSSKKPSRNPRHSPTTPLSCSAGTSQEYASEESTRNQASVVGVGVAPERPARSTKINEDDDKAVSKKSRKRKSLAELKDMENSLVKQGQELKMEIEALREILEKKRAANDSLKRMKNELYLLPGNETTSPPDASSPPRSSRPQNDTDPPSCKEFIVPDLNMPVEEDLKPVGKSAS